MARPKKQTIEYFPHYVSGGKTLFILESEFGNDGYAFWFKLLELLGSTNGHVYDTRNPSEMRFLVAKTRVSEEETLKILNLLAELDAIDKELWSKGIIWCQNLIDNVSEVYVKRKSDKPKKPIIEEFSEQKSQKNDVIEEFSERKPQLNEVSGSINPQSKVKESKVKESKENNNNKSLLLFEELGFGSISSIILEDIKLLEKEYTETWVIEALKEANAAGVRNLKYVIGILKNWKSKGFKAEKPQQVKSNKPNGFNNFDGRDYVSGYGGETYDSLEDKLTSFYQE